MTTSKEGRSDTNVDNSVKRLIGEYVQSHAKTYMNALSSLRRAEPSSLGLFEDVSASQDAC